MPVEYVALSIPFAGIGAGIAISFFAIWMNHRRKMMDKKVEMSTGQAIENAANVKELNKRVQVLESIVTDSGFDVSQKIESLRDASKSMMLNGRKQAN